MADLDDVGHDPPCSADRVVVEKTRKCVRLTTDCDFDADVNHDEQCEEMKGLQFEHFLVPATCNCLFLLGALADLGQTF